MDPRLIELLKCEAGRPMQWGVNDCFLFTAEVVMLLGGPDLAIGWRGFYTSRKTLKPLLRKAGGLRIALTSRLQDLGWTLGADGHIAVGMVHRSVAVRLPSTWWAVKGQKGLVFVPTEFVKEVWSCPS